MPRDETPAFFSAPWEPADASAVQALARGEANPEQQKRALDWVIKTGAATYNTSFTPGSPDATAFAEGRRFVGTQIVKLLSINVAAFVKEQHRHA
jgi:hypothetical protein